MSNYRSDDRPLACFFVPSNVEILLVTTNYIRIPSVGNCGGKLLLKPLKLILLPLLLPTLGKKRKDWRRDSFVA